MWKRIVFFLFFFDMLKNGPAFYLCLSHVKDQLREALSAASNDFLSRSAPSSSRQTRGEATTLVGHLDEGLGNACLGCLSTYSRLSQVERKDYMIRRNSFTPGSCFWGGGVTGGSARNERPSNVFFFFLKNPFPPSKLRPPAREAGVFHWFPVRCSLSVCS